MIEFNTDDEETDEAYERPGYTSRYLMVRALLIALVLIAAIASITFYNVRSMNTDTAVQVACVQSGGDWVHTGVLGHLAECRHR